MDACCANKEHELRTLRNEQRGVLTLVLIINAVLFVVEAAAGISAHSAALLADSLDMLGDALVYGFSLYVLSRSAQWKATAAISKGVIMTIFGAGVLVQAVYKAISGTIPAAETMGMIGALVLLGNGICFLLLYRHRVDDLNMHSTWLCSRNDIIANASVLAAAGGVKLLGSGWPDIVVGAVIAGLFLKSALTVLRESLHELQTVNKSDSRAESFTSF
jgi:Co/Zn/Cd efflux system component